MFGKELNGVILCVSEMDVFVGFPEQLRDECGRGSIQHSREYNIE
jgi:hypothetical protein